MDSVMPLLQSNQALLNGEFLKNGGKGPRKMTDLWQTCPLRFPTSQETALSIGSFITGVCSGPTHWRTGG
jgi:hypothetical protein